MLCNLLLRAGYRIKHSANCAKAALIAAVKHTTTDTAQSQRGNLRRAQTMGIRPSTTSSCAFLSVEVSDVSDSGREVPYAVSTSGVSAALCSRQSVTCKDPQDDDIQEDPPFLLQEHWLTDVCGVPRRRWVFFIQQKV